MVQVPTPLNILTDWGIVDSSDNFTRFGATLLITLIASAAIFAVVKLIRFGDKISEDDDDVEYSRQTAPESNYTQKTLNVKSRPINMENKYAGMDTPTLVKAILKDLNCKYEESDDHIDFLFSYQGENFVARAPDKDNPRVRLFDLDWCRCPLSNLEEMSCMQKVINAVNTRQMCSAIYYINKETKEMVVYSKADFLIWSDMPHPDDYMRMWLDNFFFLKQNFAVDLENEKQRVKIK